MLDSMIYVNHLGESIKLSKSNGIFCNYNDIRDYEWEYSTTNDTITSFSKGVVKKTIPLLIKSDNSTEIRNKLTEYMEKDILSLKQGKLIIGGYYLKCYITSNKKTNYLISDNYINLELTVVTDYPYWIKENNYNFMKVTESEIITDKRNLDFNYDFDYDYTSNLLNKTLDNTSFTSSNFKLIIYGPVDNPNVIINGNVYNVDVKIEEGEYLTIDSKNKTIILTDIKGNTTNEFNNRNRDNYIFEKISNGNNKVKWNGEFGFDVVIYEERSEPKWI